MVSGHFEWQQLPVQSFFTHHTNELQRRMRRLAFYVSGSQPFTFCGLPLTLDSVQMGQIGPVRVHLVPFVYCYRLVRVNLDPLKGT